MEGEPGMGSFFFACDAAFFRLSVNAIRGYEENERPDS